MTERRASSVDVEADVVGTSQKRATNVDIEADISAQTIQRRASAVMLEVDYSVVPVDSMWGWAHENPQAWGSA